MVKKANPLAIDSLFLRARKARSELGSRLGARLRSQLCRCLEGFLGAASELFSKLAARSYREICKDTANQLRFTRISKPGPLFRGVFPPKVMNPH